MSSSTNPKVKLRTRRELRAVRITIATLVVCAVLATSVAFLAHDRRQDVAQVAIGATDHATSTPTPESPPITPEPALAPSGAPLWQRMRPMPRIVGIRGSAKLLRGSPSRRLKWRVLFPRSVAVVLFRPPADPRGAARTPIGSISPGGPGSGAKGTAAGDFLLTDEAIGTYSYVGVFDTSPPRHHRPGYTRTLARVAISCLVRRVGC